ncbi:aromatic acid exporter family protein [Acetobacterium sp.]|uniref:FUSC family protein n=1 Tax=Acetobacterium sp. TaxID=1872094 RepID=UPI00272886E3|nr:FUSC family protein [Acetobacterium sp.]MDO9492439.1 FUSC family protein [Acetobacterium sp.]
MKLCHLPSIGMRNIKTMLAVFICVVVFAIMGPGFNPLVAAIAAVITMGPSIENSIETGWNRILGTAFGGAAGMLGIFAANLIPYEFAYVFIIPLGIMGLIYLCNNINKSGAIVITCVVFLILMTTYPRDAGIYMLAILRLLETSFGIIVAFLINRFIKVPECDEKSADAESETKKELITVAEKPGSSRKKFKVSNILYMIFKP